jgi:NitT/TauT family transport system substrate-binding protein
MGSVRALGLALGAVLVIAGAACATPAPGSSPAPAAASAVAPTASAAAATAGPNGQASRATPLQPPVAVRMVEVPGAFNAGIYLAHLRGYFREEGLDLSLEPFDTSERLLPALVAGQADVAVGGVAAAIFNAVARDLPLKIVVGQGRMEPGFSSSALMVRKPLYDAGAIREYADLRDRRIAVPSWASALGADLHRALRLGGLTETDADVKVLGFGDMPASLANGAVDVAFMSEPFVARSVQQDIAVRWKEAVEITPGHQLSVLLYSTDFPRREPEAAVRFVVAYLRGAREYMATMRGDGDKTEMYRMLAEYTAIKDLSIYPRMVLTAIHPDGAINRDTLEADQALWVAQGHVTQPADLDRVIDTQYLQEALRRLGTAP